MFKLFSQIMVPGLEILIIMIMIYYLLSFFWNTRAMDLVFGLLAFLALYLVSTWLHLPVIQKLMLYFVNVAVIALLIIFQPELRLALSKLSVKGKKYKEITEFDKFLDAIAQSIYRMADRRIGALVLLENQDSLDEFANKAVILNARFSPNFSNLFSSRPPPYMMERSLFAAQPYFRPRRFCRWPMTAPSLPSPWEPVTAPAWASARLPMR